MIVVHNSVQDLHLLQVCEITTQICDITMAIHSNVNKAHLREYYIVRLKSIKKYISTGLCSMCASQMHTYYHLEFQQSPTSISIIKNLQAEACNTAYWIYKSQKHTGRPSSAATEAYWKAK